MYGEHFIEGLPRTVHVDAGQPELIDNNNARVACIALFGESAKAGNVTFDDCKTMVNNPQTKAMLVGSDCTFFMEIDWLNQKAETIMEENLREQVAALFPQGEKQPYDMDECL